MKNNLNQLNTNIKILKNISKHDFELFKNHLHSQKQLKILENNLLEAGALIESNLSELNNQLMEFDKIEKIKKVHLLSNKLKSLLISKGSLSRPLVGVPVKEFGPSYDSQNSYYLVNSGETYKTKVNTPVKTVGLGTLIFRDPLARWHETLIVQHDDNYYSVYAGVKNSKINVGDKLNQGQTLGLAATDSFYFELRHFDYPINPKTWFSKE